MFRVLSPKVNSDDSIAADSVDNRNPQSKTNILNYLQKEDLFPITNIQQFPDKQQILLNHTISHFENNNILQQEQEQTNYMDTIADILINASKNKKGIYIEIDGKKSTLDIEGLTKALTKKKCKAYNFEDPGDISLFSEKSKAEKNPFLFFLWNCFNDRQLLISILKKLMYKQTNYISEKKYHGKYNSINYSQDLKMVLIGEKKDNLFDLLAEQIPFFENNMASFDFQKNQISIHIHQNTVNNNNINNGTLNNYSTSEDFYKMVIRLKFLEEENEILKKDYGKMKEEYSKMKFQMNSLKDEMKELKNYLMKLTIPGLMRVVVHKATRKSNCAFYWT